MTALPNYPFKYDLIYMKNTILLLKMDAPLSCSVHCVSVWQAGPVRWKARAPSVETIIIVYWRNRFVCLAPVHICVCTQGSVKGFYLQSVFVVLSNISNHSHVCWCLKRNGSRRTQKCLSYSKSSHRSKRQSFCTVLSSACSRMLSF